MMSENGKDRMDVDSGYYELGRDDAVSAAGTADAANVASPASAANAASPVSPAKPFSRRGFLGAAACTVAAVAAAPVMLLSCSGVPLLKRNVRQEGDATVLPAGFEMVDSLSIVESAWLPSNSSNKVPCAFALQNVSSNVGFRMVSVRVVGGDDKGMLLIDEQVTIPCVFPGETCNMGVLVGNLDFDQAERLQFVHFLVAGAQEAVVYADEVPLVEQNYPYNLAEARDATYTPYRAFFDVTLSSSYAHIDKPLLGDAVLDAAYVSAVVRDADGNMICGYGKYVEGLKPEEPLREEFFAAQRLWDRPLTTVELYARPWLRDEWGNVSKTIVVTEQEW